MPVSTCRSQPIGDKHTSSWYRRCLLAGWWPQDGGTAKDTLKMTGLQEVVLTRGAPRAVYVCVAIAHVVNSLLC